MCVWYAGLSEPGVLWVGAMAYYYFFQAKTGFCNFYMTIYEYLKPDLKNLISGLSESVKKCAKN